MMDQILVDNATAETRQMALLPAEAVLDRFATLVGAPIAELAGPAQTRGITRLRHEAAYLMRLMSTASMAQIGQLLGGRDGATIDGAIDKVTSRLLVEPDYRIYLGNLLERIAKPERHWAEDKVQLTAIRMVLADRSLSDSDARTAALQLVDRMHG